MSLPKYPLLNETAANLLIDYFKSNFNQYLSDADNEYDDGISLAPVDDTAIHISDKIETLTIPAVYFLFGVMAFNYTQDPNYLDATNSCVVVLTCEDEGADKLTRKAWRYGRVLYGTFNLIDFSDSDGRLKMRSVPKRLGYSDDRVAGKLNGREGRFRKDVVLELDLMHYEKILT